MSALAVATAHRLGAAGIVVTNRTPERAAAAGGVGVRVHRRFRRPARRARRTPTWSSPAPGRPAWSSRPGWPREALRLRSGAGGEAETRPLVLLDLALPHDVDRAAAGLPGVSVLGLDSLEAAGLAVAVTQADDVAAVRAIVAEELAARISARHAARVSPTVIALRAKAAEVVEAELDRLTGKLGPLDERAKAEIVAGDAAGGGQAAARADGAGQGAGRLARRRLLRGGPAGALRPRPGRDRLRHQGRRGPHAWAEADEQRRRCGSARARARWPWPSPRPWPA